VSAGTRTTARPRAAADEALRKALADLAAAGVRIADFSVGQPSLDEVFLALTGHTAEQPPASSSDKTLEGSLA